MSRSFDGTNDNINMGNTNDVSTGQVSLATWVYQVATGQALAGKKFDGTATQAGYFMSGRGGGGIFWRVCDGVVQTSVTTGGATQGRWVFLCGTFNGTTDSANLYVNDTVKILNAFTGGSLANTANFTLGEFGGGSTDYNGREAFVHMYNRVLNDGEVLQIMRYPGSIRQNLQGFWPLWGVPTEPDISGSQFSGTVTGAIPSLDGPPINGMVISSPMGSYAA